MISLAGQVQQEESSMEYYLISEQDVYELTVEIENFIIQAIEKKKVKNEDYPDDEEELKSDPHRDPIDYEKFTF